MYIQYASATPTDVSGLTLYARTRDRNARLGRRRLRADGMGQARRDARAARGRHAAMWAGGVARSELPLHGLPALRPVAVSRRARTAVFPSRWSVLRSVL